MSNIYFLQNIVFFSTWRWLASYLQFSFDVFMLICSVYTGLLVSVQDTRNTAHTTEQLFFLQDSVDWRKYKLSMNLSYSLLITWVEVSVITVVF